MLIPESLPSSLGDGSRHLLKPERPGGIAPVLKWAGGKSQLLDRLLPLVPSGYGKYIEPFVGGGALFFATLPTRAIISDSNPELIAFYKGVRDDVAAVIEAANSWRTDERTFYRVRKMDPMALAPAIRAGRTLYLNRTCFNGLYRVNKRGEFNVPYGGYKNPRICDEKALHAASRALLHTTIIEADFLEVLREHAQTGDFVFLDPPYAPVGQFADFKRYTKEQFHSQDHEALAQEALRLRQLGCHVVLTNSNAPLTRKLYGGFDTRMVLTRRSINCDGKKRFGEDIVVCLRPTGDSLFPGVLSKQVEAYPSTRFMGSKEKLLADIWSVASNFKAQRVLDLFSGSGVVSYMFKAQGKAVTSNDYMSLSATFAKALIENNTVRLSDDDLQFLTHGRATSRFVRDTFAGLYFSDADNLFVDQVRSRIAELNDETKRALAKAALIRACMKKRARGIFTYVGVRYDDGRRDMHITLRQHFKEAVASVNHAVFNNGLQNRALNLNALEVTSDADLVYIDPPYYGKLSDNDYIRRYHFVEGLARDWAGVEIQQHTKTRKFKTYGSPFSTHEGARQAFAAIFRRYAESVIVVSYSSNSLPDKETMLALLRQVKRSVEVIPVDHRYSFGNQGHKIGNANNKVSEYLFVAS
jgi:DNA adenine methylase